MYNFIIAFKYICLGELVIPVQIIFISIIHLLWQMEEIMPPGNQKRLSIKEYNNKKILKAVGNIDNI